MRVRVCLVFRTLTGRGNGTSDLFVSAVTCLSCESCNLPLATDLAGVMPVTVTLPLTVIANRKREEGENRERRAAAVRPKPCVTYIY